jgi:sec-independent protein translocase protein TatA
MFGLGIQELLIILVIVLLIFGARKLPEIASDLGKAIKGFKRSINENDEIDVTPKQDEIENKKKNV